jgi:hypothetical protein
MLHFHFYIAWTTQCTFVMIVFIFPIISVNIGVSKYQFSYFGWILNPSTNIVCHYTTLVTSCNFSIVIGPHNKCCCMASGKKTCICKIPMLLGEPFWFHCTAVHPPAIDGTTFWFILGKFIDSRHDCTVVFSK